MEWGELERLPIFDLGVPGAFAFWGVAGLALGWAFALFRRGDIRGLVLYPVLFIGLLEAGRILYWPQGRALPSIAAAVFLGVRLRSLSAAAQVAPVHPSGGLPAVRRTL